ncbi:MAG TPA: hypothetical protein VFE20_01725 [Thermoleophilia bacterium]|nr:hypothetical protein [Thermoleophilia bacterium]
MNAILRTTFIVLIGTALATGCSQNTSALPSLNSDDVVSALVGPSGAILETGEAIPRLPEGVSLAGFLAAYAEATETDWEGDTTPQFSAILELHDRRRVVLHFSPEYPAGCSIVGVVPAPETASDERQAWFRVLAPDLKRNVMELGRNLEALTDSK